MRAQKYVPHPMRRSGNITFDEFCKLIREDQKADLIDGVIYMASPENVDDNELFVWLIRLTADFVDERELGGHVYGSRVAFELSETNSPEPDIAFVTTEHEDRVHWGRVEGPPDFAIEIVTPDSVERDYEDKRLLYEQHGVSEYWIVDEHRQTVTAYRLDRRGRFRQVRPRRGVLESSVIDGFWLRPSWLWENPRPKKAACLREILAGPAR